MIPTIVEKQILSSLRTNKLKKEQTGKNLPPPHRCPPFFFLQTVTHAQKMLTPRGPQIASKVRSQGIKLRSQVSKLRSQVSKLRSQVSKLRSQVSKLRSQVINLRSQVSKLRRKNRCVPYEPPYLAHVTPSNFFSRILKSEALVCD